VIVAAAAALCSRLFTAALCDTCITPTEPLHEFDLGVLFHEYDCIINSHTLEICTPAAASRFL
jgi:hypothetical protein